MKIVIMRSNPVLPDPRVEKEANSLLGMGHEVSILAWNRQVSGRSSKYSCLQLKNGRVSVKWLNIKAAFGGGLRNLFPLILFQLGLLSWLIKHHREYDVIHACDFDTVIPAWLCARFFKKKYVYDIFDYYTDSFSVPALLKPVVERVDIHMINSADAVIIVNESRQEQIAKSTPRRLFIIHNAPEPSVPQCNGGTILVNQSDRPKFVYVGILGRDRLLKEIMEVFKQHCEWELYLAGFGPYHEYIKKTAGNCSNIFYLGRIPYSQTISLEAQCDVLIAVYDPERPHHKYCSPNKFYEALMLGKPIIVAENTGIDKIVAQYALGKVIDYSKKGFMKAADELIQEKELWSVKGDRMKELFGELYSWSIMEGRLACLYNEIL